MICESNMIRKRFVACLALACGLLPLSGQPGQSTEAKVQRLIDGSGFSNSHRKPGAWIGDAFVRTEISARILGAREFKKIIDQVTAATDALHTRIKSYLK